MTTNAKIGLALVGGYVLGRTKKAKMAIGLGMFLAGKKLRLDPESLKKLLSQSPVLGELNSQVREEVLGATRTAAKGALTKRVGSFADSLHERTAGLGRGGGGDGEDEPPEDDGPAGESAGGDSPQDEERQPAKRAASGAGGGAASKARKSAPAKRAASGGTAAKGAAKAAAKTAGGARKTAGTARKTASRTTRGAGRQGGGSRG